MAGAGVRDQHVEPLETSERLLDGRGIRDVERDPLPAERGGDAVGRGAVEVGDDHVVARLGEPLGVGAPEPVGAARHERHALPAIRRP